MNNDPVEEGTSESHLDVIRTVLSKWRQRFEGCSFIGRKERSRSRRKPAKQSKKAIDLPLDSTNDHAAELSEVNVCNKISSKMIVRFTALPTGIDKQEWIAHHAFSLFDHINALCSNISQICTPVTCSTMNCPGNIKVPFLDERGKRCHYPAMQYIDAVMSYCEDIGKNEELFPTKYSAPFGDDFENIVRRIFRMLWHCLGHLYESHWDTLGACDLYPQYLLVAAHMAQFSKHFDLLDSADQNALDEIVIKKRQSHQSEDENQEKVKHSNSLHDSPNHFTPILSKSHSWSGMMSNSSVISSPSSIHPVNNRFSSDEKLKTLATGTF